MSGGSTPQRKTSHRGFNPKAREVLLDPEGSVKRVGRVGSDEEFLRRISLKSTQRLYLSECGKTQSLGDLNNQQKPDLLRAMKQMKLVSQTQSRDNSVPPVLKSVEENSCEN